MATTTLPITTPSGSQHEGTPDAPDRGQSGRRGRRAGVVAGAALLAVAAAGTGVLIGVNATSSPAPLARPAARFPSDWQLYRAGERGVLVPAPQPGDWSTYRAGERAGGTTTPSVANAMTFPSAWQVYRAGER